MNDPTVNASSGTIVSLRKEAKVSWKFWIGLILIGLLNLGVRGYYVSQARTLQPDSVHGLRGDAVDYYQYAWNLAHRQTFTRSTPETTPPVSDSFRDPGYPVMMAAGMRIFPQWKAWYSCMLAAQTVLGSLTIVFLMAASRRFLPQPWLLAAGILAAIWPHSITIVSFLISETLFGFLVALALLLTSEALTRRRIGLLGMAGITFSLASLTNAVLLPFAPLCALVLALRHTISWRSAITLACMAALIPAIWAVRNYNLPSADSSSSRAELNLVQGSWPNYHTAYQMIFHGDESGLSVIKEANTEYKLLHTNKIAGIHMMLERMSLAPLNYVKWYMSKPILLWAWDIQVGDGDIYVYPTQNSPFRDNIFFLTIISLAHTLNFLLLSMACLGVIAAARSSQHTEALVIALLLAFTTAVYSILQSEPRYSIALRGEEMILAMLGAHSFFRLLTRPKKVKTRSTTDMNHPG